MDRHTHRFLPLVLLIWVISACNLFNLVSKEPSSTATPLRESTVEAVASLSASEPWPLKDMTVRPQIWFGPLDPPAWSQLNPGGGPYDFFDLFSEDAPWERSSDAVRVMLLYPTWLSGTASHSQLTRVFEDLRRRRIAIAFEAGPLTERGPCNAGTIEGFSGAPSAQQIAENIQAAGGVLYSMSLEHGFDAATYYDPACRMNPTDIAQDVSGTIAAVRRVFPDVVVGSIETADLSVDDVAAWLTAYRDVTGEELGYFHLDINFLVPDWAARAKTIEDYVQSRGVPFGVYYHGDAEDASDEAWLGEAEDRLVEFEVIHGGRPDQVMFQSWDPRPGTLLPEDQPGTFTHLITRYLRPRTTLTLELSGQVAFGSLTLADGVPLAGAPIEMSYIPVSGEGVFADYTLTGVVPDGATHADVGLRINTECDCSGPARLVLASADYVDEGRSGNQVPNGSFDAGLQGWGVWGAGSTGLSAGEGGSGQALRIEAGSDQDVGLNSAGFAVTPGHAFTLNFRARVDPPSDASGYFDIVFQNDSGEVKRFTLPIQVMRVVVGTAETADEGTYTFQMTGLPSGTQHVRAWFGGTDDVWPAAADREFSP